MLHGKMYCCELRARTKDFIGLCLFCFTEYVAGITQYDEVHVMMRYTESQLTVTLWDSPAEMKYRCNPKELRNIASMWKTTTTKKNQKQSNKKTQQQQNPAFPSCVLSCSLCRFSLIFQSESNSPPYFLIH